MRKLKLKDWASVAEISASFVVVASLAYIGLELNQNTKVGFSAPFQDYIESDVLPGCTDQNSG